MLSDESRFQLNLDDHRRCVWRRPVDLAFTISRHVGSQPRVMVWGAISYDSRTPLYPGLIFQQDNAKPPTERVAKNCFTACQTLPWPARLPDLSPIEYVWDMMGSVVPATISSQSSHHCWTSPLPHASALIQRDFGCVLGLQQTKKLPYIAKVDLVWQLGV
ncbi:transposable element Tc1 transposase [Trichonephila clavipes]|nr:transposable element Tc1 transposase [Trichonephila clavipes]